MTYEVLRPLSDWHEDDGDVLWYRVPISEPPFVSSPLSSDWLIETSDGRCVKVDDDEEDHKPWATHWHPLPRVVFEPGEHDEIKRLRAALADIARGDYSDPFCMKTPEQRAREALAPKKEKP